MEQYGSSIRDIHLHNYWRMSDYLLIAGSVIIHPLFRNTGPFIPHIWIHTSSLRNCHHTCQFETITLLTSCYAFGVAGILPGS
jgi:hypothetical protein